MRLWPARATARDAAGSIDHAAQERTRRQHQQDLAQDDAVAGRLHEALGRWSRDTTKSFVSPTQEQRPRVTQRWALLRDGLPMSLQKQLAFHLQTFGLL